MCRLTVPLPPHFWSAAEGLVLDYVQDKAKKLRHSFLKFAQIYRQKKIRSPENQLKIPPKLSTACSHAAELDKVLSMNFLQNYLSGFRTTYLTQRLDRAT